jgi:hypothetical protein
VYRILPTRESVAIAARFRGYNWLLDANGELVDQIRWQDFENLGLVELQVLGNYTPQDLTTIHQNDQVPYLEYYMDPTGVDQLDESAAIETQGRRVCFFLHFVDTSRPLEIGNAKVQIPDFSHLPERLKPFTHYVPVD